MPCASPHGNGLWGKWKASQMESLYSPVPSPSPPAELPWKMAVDAPLPDKTCGAVVWRRPPICAAGSLSKTCPVARFVPLRSFVSAPSTERLSPCPPSKCFFPLFSAPLSRLRGNEGAGRFPNFGRGKRRLPQLRAPQPGGVRQLFVRGGAGGVGPAAWAGGWGEKRGLGRRVAHPTRTLICFVLLKIPAFSFPFIH